MKQQKKKMCAKVTTLLDAYVDGELNQRQAAAVQRHLRGCPSCQAAEEELHALSRLVANAALDVEPPATLHASVMRVVTESPQLEPKRSRTLMWRRTGGVLASLCFVCVLGVALFVGQSMNKSSWFDSDLAPEASDPLFPSLNEDKNTDNSSSLPEQTPDSVDPTAPAEPMDPADPDEPMDPADPEEPMDPAPLSYTLTRMAGENAVYDEGLLALLDGEWQGQDMMLSLKVQSMQAKVSVNGSEMRTAAFQLTNHELLLCFEGGDCMRFMVKAEEDTLWLTLIS